MQEITITLPAIDEAVIASLNTLTTQAAATEREALKALREEYSALAKHNGYIRIAHWSVSTSNYSADKDVHFERDGRKARALLAFDNFSEPLTDQNSGTYEGDKLYLLESGEWLRIERRGSWSRWQGSPSQWGCGVSAHDDSEYDAPGGEVRFVSDAEVEAEYPLNGIVEQLAKSLNTLAEKLPARMVKVQQRVAFAEKLLAGLHALE